MTLWREGVAAGGGGGGGPKFYMDKNTITTV